MDEEFFIGAGLLALVLSVGLGFAVFATCQERDTFNKFKSPDQPVATFWDAAFSELRIESN